MSLTTAILALAIALAIQGCARAIQSWLRA